MSKEGDMTTGMLVGYTPESESDVYIGSIFVVDWTEFGGLEDYEGEVNITLKNSNRKPLTGPIDF